MNNSTRNNQFKRKSLIIEKNNSIQSQATNKGQKTGNLKEKVKGLLNRTRK